MATVGGSRSVGSVGESPKKCGLLVGFSHLYRAKCGSPRPQSFFPDKTVHFAATAVGQRDILSSSSTCPATNSKAFIYVQYHYTLPLPCSCSGIHNFPLVQSNFVTGTRKWDKEMILKVDKMLA